MIRLTIRAKLISIFFGIVVISVLFGGLRSYHVSRQALEKKTGEGLQRQAFSMANQLDRILFERYRNIQGWAGNEIMTDVLTQDAGGKIKNFLTSVKKEYGLYSDLIYTDAMGNVIASSNPKFLGQSVLGEAWFQHVLIHREIYAESGTPKISGSHTVIFASPTWANVMRNFSEFAAEPAEKKSAQPAAEAPQTTVILGEEKSEIIGVLIAFLDWSEVLDLLNTTPLSPGKDQNKNAYAMLMNRAGLAITQPYFEDRAVFLRENLTAELGAARLAAQGKDGYLIEKGRYQEENLIGFASSRGYRDFKGFGWSVLIFEDTKENLASIRALAMQIIGFGIFVALLVCGASLFLAGGITKPLEKLVVLTRDIGRGDFSRRIEVSSRDEMGMLAGSFNEMIQALEKSSQDLTDSKNYTDNILRSSLDTLIVLDMQGKIKTCNPALLKLLGYEEQELLGAPLEKLISEDDLKNTSLIDDLRRGALSHAEIQYKTKKQALLPVLVSAARMNGQDNRFHGVVVNGKDIAEYKKLEKQFLQAQKMDAVGRLAGGIAHDFNNVLTIINCFGEKILRCSSPEAGIAQDINEMLTAGWRGARLVRQLLAFSRLQIIKPSIVNMNDLILNMSKMIQLLIGAATELVIVPAPDLWTVKVDAGQMEQVLANLAANARDAMPAGKGRLSFEMKNVTLKEDIQDGNLVIKKGDFIRTSVTDNGSGMSEEIQKHIFEPFFTTKDKSTGTGLGLATCYGIIKQAGGYIQVESRINEGTTFHVYLPRVNGTPEALPDKKSFASKELPRGTETVLLVEDEKTLRNVCTQILQGQGYTVIQAENGSGALQAAQELKGRPFHLLITDMVMPVMGGTELAGEVLKMFPGVRVLFISGYTQDPLIRSQSFNSGTSFLPKPFTASDLALQVRRLLDHP